MIGKTVSHYKILEKLGGGGMGVVYKAEDERLKRVVALKFLPPELTRDPDAKKRFIHEAQAASALDHPNICTIHEVDETPEGRMFIVMAYYEGSTLKKRIEEGPMDVGEVLSLGIQMAQGLERAHEAGMVHRDVKPANVMVTGRGEVRLVDFGLAKLAGQTRLTREGSTVGTAAYMSPEQARGDEVDERSDIWSLGVVLYEMVTGRLPFRGDFEQAVVYSILNEDPVPMGEVVGGVPASLEGVIAKALSKEVSERYQTVGELWEGLEAVVAEVGVTVRGVSGRVRVAGRRRARGRGYAMGAGLVVVLVVVFLMLRPMLFDEVLIGEPKPIAVISFENDTGDPGYDYLEKAVPNLLITSLEQSRYLRVATWERMGDLLRQMGREVGDAIDKETGFELCRMDGIEAVVVGSVVKAGNVFATDVKVLDVETKRILKSVSVQGEGVESILKKQIDELSREISRGIGLSERKIFADRQRITDVTTNSMEAYNFFLRGKEDFLKFSYPEAARFLSKAVEIDSTFAVAYLFLARVHGGLRDTKARKGAYEKAKKYSQHASTKEKLYIEASYAGFIEQDREKRYRILKEIDARYPKEKRVHFLLAAHYRTVKAYPQAIDECSKVLALDPNHMHTINLAAYTYMDMGDYTKAIEFFNRYAAVSPGDPNPFDSMGDLLLRMGKLEEALAKYKEALDVDPTFYYADWEIAYVYAMKENYAETSRWIDRFIEEAPSPGIEAEGHMWKGFYYCWLGSRDRAIAEFERAEFLWNEVGNEWDRAYVDWIMAWIHLDRREYELSRARLTKWHEFAVQTRPAEIPYYTALYTFCAGLLDIATGDVESAKSKSDKMETLLSTVDPQLKERIAYRHDLLQVEVCLASGAASDGIQTYAAIVEEDIPDMYMRDIIDYNLPFHNDVLARCYHANGDLDKAIAEYENLTFFSPERKERRLIHPVFHYSLARLYEERGMVANAILQYEQFLDIWKAADEGLPERIDAAARLESLTGKIP